MTERSDAPKHERFANDELDAILKDLTVAYEAIASVAMLIPSAHPVVKSRQKLPDVIGMVFAQAKAVPSERAARGVPVDYRNMVLEEAAIAAGKKGDFKHIGDDADYWNGYSAGRRDAEQEIRALKKRRDDGDSTP